MSSIVEQMTSVYVLVDDYLKAHPAMANWRHSPNNHPAFTDAEVIAIGLLQGCFGVATLKQTYRLVADNYRDAFPLLPNYQQWLARLHSLSFLVGYVCSYVASRTEQVHEERLFVIDGKPIPVCKPIRHGRVRLLREDGAWFSKSSTGWFFGFKLHALVHQATGLVISVCLTPANLPERDCLVPLGAAVEGGILLADTGYRGHDHADVLAEETGLLLVTTTRGETTPEQHSLITTLRERIETTFSCLWNRFVDRVFSRSFHGLWNTVQLKILHFNLSQAGLLHA